VLAALAVHAWALGPHRAHLLWSCHIASATIAVGLLAGSARAVAAGFLFHLAIGFPAWLVEEVTTWPDVMPTSLLAHTLPPVAAFLYLRRRSLPRGIVVPAWAIYILPIPLARWLTPPELNINLAHQVWPGFSAIVSSAWTFQLIAIPVALALLLAADFVLRSVFRDSSKQ
jgi:hypothetical protein